MFLPIPADLINVQTEKLEAIDAKVKEIYRLITFSREHSADDLLNRFVSSNNSLTQLLSIKNAQMEAESEEEIQRYLKNLNLAIQFVVGEIDAGRNFNGLPQLFQLFRIISPETHAKHPNKFRTQLVQIGPSLCPEPNSIQHLVDHMFQNLSHIPHPITRAIYLHHELIRIHPFADGNGRTVRIAKNWMLMFDLYPPIFIQDKIEKRIYLDTLEASFAALEANPNQWNEATTAFFDQELDRIMINATGVLHDLRNGF